MIMKVMGIKNVAISTLSVALMILCLLFVRTIFHLLSFLIFGEGNSSLMYSPWVVLLPAYLIQVIINFFVLKKVKVLSNQFKYILTFMPIVLFLLGIMNLFPEILDIFNFGEE